MSTITITSHVIKFSNRIIQISNIAEASIWIDNSTRDRATKWMAGGGLIFIGALLLPRYAPGADQAIPQYGIVGGIVIVIISAFFLKPKYDLLLQTNAGRVIPLASRDEALMQRVLSEIQDAMAHRNPDKNVTINVGNAIVNSAINSSIGRDMNSSIS